MLNHGTMRRLRTALGLAIAALSSLGCGQNDPEGPWVFLSVSAPGAGRFDRLVYTVSIASSGDALAAPLAADGGVVSPPPSQTFTDSKGFDSTSNPAGIVVALKSPAATGTPVVVHVDGFRGPCLAAAANALGTVSEDVKSATPVVLQVTGLCGDADAGLPSAPDAAVGPFPPGADLDAGASGDAGATAFDAAPQGPPKITLSAAPLKLTAAGAVRFMAVASGIGVTSVELRVGDGGLGVTNALAATFPVVIDSDFKAAPQAFQARALDSKGAVLAQSAVVTLDVAGVGAGGTDVAQWSNPPTLDREYQFARLQSLRDSRLLFTADLLDTSGSASKKLSPVAFTVAAGGSFQDVTPSVFINKINASVVTGAQLQSGALVLGGFDNERKAWVSALNPQGVPTWATPTLAGTAPMGYNGVVEVQVDGQDNVYVCGNLANTAGLAPFVQKFSAAGAPVWTQPYFPSLNANEIYKELKNCALDDDGTLWFSGVFEGAGFGGFVGRLDGTGKPAFVSIRASLMNGFDGLVPRGARQGAWLVANNYAGLTPGSTALFPVTATGQIGTEKQLSKGGADSVMGVARPPATDPRRHFAVTLTVANKPVLVRLRADGTDAWRKMPVSAESGPAIDNDGYVYIGDKAGVIHRYSP